MLGPRASEELVFDSSAVGIERRLTGVRLRDHALDHLHAGPDGDVGARQSWRVVRNLGLRAHPSEIEGDPGTILEVQLIAHPSPRAIATFLGPHTARVDTLHGNRDASAQSRRVRVDAAEAVRVEVAGPGFDDR